MRKFGALLACLLISSAGSAELPKLPEPYQTLAELARGAPPEFTADGLLRLVEQGHLDKAARRNLIEEAFRNASSAKFPVRLDGWPGTTTDTSSGSLSRAYALKLDALSLESRAVRDMLPVDEAETRKLLTEIPHPALAPITCDDALYYDLSDYYQALSTVVNGTFTPKEFAKGAHVNFLTDYLGQATSPLELAPLAGVVQSASVTAQQREGLWARLGGMLETMQPDDRSYAASLLALNSMSAPQLRPSLEKYRQKSQGCTTDSAGPNSTVSIAPGPNNSNGTSAANKTPKLDLYWQSSVSQQLLAPGKNLRFDSNNLPLSVAQRSTPEWQQQLDDYLNQIASWTSDQENSEVDYYHEKCTVLMALIELVPPGPQNDRVLADYVDFIGNSSLYQQSPVEWYLEPLTLLDRVQSDTVMRNKVLDAYQGSGNPVLSLEVALERASQRR